VNILAAVHGVYGETLMGISGHIFNEELARALAQAGYNDKGGHP
jgi:hypothetical protein